MDRIALALTTDDINSHDYSIEVRQVARGVREAAVMEALKMGQLSRLNVWIIHTDPAPNWKRKYSAVTARFVDVDPGKEVCLQRLASRPRSNHALVKKVLYEYYERR
jgi:hypothetical protein